MAAQLQPWGFQLQIVGKKQSLLYLELALQSLGFQLK